MRTPPVRRDCSNVHHRVVRLLRPQPRQRIAGGRCARKASAVDAVGDAAKNVFHFARADVGIELIERAVTTESAIGSAQPFDRLLCVADQIDSTGIYACDADGAVGLSGGEASALAEAAGKRALWDAELARENRVRDLEPAGESSDRGCRKAFAHQLGQIVCRPNALAQHLAATEYLCDR